MSEQIIILIDDPRFPRKKMKHLDANYAGMSSDELFERWTRCFHLMMCFDSETAGGYAITMDAEEMEKELVSRKDPRVEKFLKGEKV